jgi:hypothetical protein
MQELSRCWFLFVTDKKAHFNINWQVALTIDATYENKISAHKNGVLLLTLGGEHFFGAPKGSHSKRFGTLGQLLKISPFVPLHSAQIFFKCGVLIFS